MPLRMGGQYISSVDDVRARPPGGRAILGGELADAELAERYGLINRAQSLTVSPRFGGGSSLHARPALTRGSGGRYPFLPVRRATPEPVLTDM